MVVELVRHMYPEKEGFHLYRPEGVEFYVFVHFITPIIFKEKDYFTKIMPNTCVIFDKFYPQDWIAREPLVHNWIHLNGNDVEKILKSYSLEFNKFYKLNNGNFITSITNDIENEWFSKNEYYEEICEYKIREIFAKIKRNENKSLTKTDIRKKFEKLRLDIFYYSEKDWTVEIMAKQVNFSEARFFVLYKKTFGISPVQDLIMARIEKAKRLLSQNKYNVKEVAENVGYSNEYHFIRQFKKYTGITPGKYNS